MLTDTNLRAAVDALWDKLWSGGLSNPLDAIEQWSFPDSLALRRDSLMKIPGPRCQSAEQPAVIGQPSRDHMHHFTFALH